MHHSSTFRLCDQWHSWLSKARGSSVRVPALCMTGMMWKGVAFYVRSLGDHPINFLLFRFQILYSDAPFIKNDCSKELCCSGWRGQDLHDLQGSSSWHWGVQILLPFCQLCTCLRYSWFQSQCQCQVWRNFQLYWLGYSLWYSLSCALTHTVPSSLNLSITHFPPHFLSSTPDHWCQWDQNSQTKPCDLGDISTFVTCPTPRVCANTHTPGQNCTEPQRVMSMLYRVCCLFLIVVLLSRVAVSEIVIRCHIKKMRQIDFTVFAVAPPQRLRPYWGNLLAGFQGPTSAGGRLMLLNTQLSETCTLIRYFWQAEHTVSVTSISFCCTVQSLIRGRIMKVM